MLHEHTAENDAARGRGTEVLDVEVAGAFWCVDGEVGQSNDDVVLLALKQHIKRERVCESFILGTGLIEGAEAAGAFIARKNFIVEIRPIQEIQGLFVSVVWETNPLEVQRDDCRGGYIVFAIWISELLKEVVVSSVITGVDCLHSHTKGDICKWIHSINLGQIDSVR